MTMHATHPPTLRRLGIALSLVALLAAPAAIPAHGQALPKPEPTAQTAPAPSPEFEVASVRPSPPDGVLYTSPWGTDGFTARNASLLYLIETAYGVQPDQIAGGPDWLASQPFDVSARTADGVKLDWKQVQAPLRQLLADRFHLTTHREQRESDGFALVVADGGPKLQPTKPGDKAYGFILPNGLEAGDMNMNGLASMLALPAGHPVIDKTGIAGNFNFKLSYATANTADSSDPDIFTALQQQLGLKLVAQKVPVEMLVIDHVDKVPTAN